MRLKTYQYSVLVLMIALVGFAQAQVSEIKKGTLIQIPAKFEVKAPVAKVWDVVSTAKGFCALTGFTPAAADQGKSFRSVGAAVNAEIWGDKGKLVATYVVPGKELRVSWEPEKGHYLCAKTIALTGTATGTTVEYLDRYTDDQAAASVDKTAKEVVEGTKKAIAAFIAMVETGAPKTTQGRKQSPSGTKNGKDGEEYEKPETPVNRN